MSCSVLLSAWPICRLPVTFGGGMTTQNGLASLRSGRPDWKAPVSSQKAETRASTAAASNDLSIIEVQASASSGQLNTDCLRSARGGRSGDRLTTRGRDGLKPTAAAQ